MSILFQFFDPDTIHYTIHFNWQFFFTISYCQGVSASCNGSHMGHLKFEITLTHNTTQIITTLQFDDTSTNVGHFALSSNERDRGQSVKSKLQKRNRTYEPTHFPNLQQAKCFCPVTQALYITRQLHLHQPSQICLVLKVSSQLHAQMLGGQFTDNFQYYTIIMWVLVRLESTRGNPNKHPQSNDLRKV